MLVLAAALSSAGLIAASPAPAASAAPSPAPRPAARLSPGPAAAVIEGVVRGPDGKPLAGALVAASSEHPDFARPPATARTTAAGQFRLAPRAASSFIVRVEAAGLAAQTLRHVHAGAPLSVTLTRGAAIEGTVLDTTSGAPVGSATVEARQETRGVALQWDPDAGVVRATTDAKGRYRLEGLAAGLYSLTAFARGAGRAERRSVPAGKPADLLLRPGGSVTGAVTDPKGKPVAGSLVRLHPLMAFGARPTMLVSTDAQGAFAVYGVAPGQYQAVAHHPDFAPAVSDPFAVERDAEARALLVLFPAATVHGRLLGTADRPARGRVVVREIAGAPAPDVLEADLAAEAGEDGVFRLRVGPGSYVAEARAPGYALRRIDLDVPAAGEGVDLGDVALEVGITIRGRVRDAGGHAVEGAEVNGYSQENPTQPLTARAEADGTYVMAGLGPGLYDLSATAPGMGMARRKADAGAAGVDFVLAPAGSITGTVVDEGGKPVDGFRVSARPTGRQATSGGRSDTFGAADGRFSLEDVSEGEYVLDVNAPDRAPAAVSGIKVAAGRTADVGTVRLSAGGTVRGLVVDAASAPVMGASVTVSGPGRGFMRPTVPATTDPGGAFELRGVEPGTVQVMASHPSYATASVAGIEVDPTRGPAEVRVVLSQGGRIEGHVRARDGALPAGAVVTVRSVRPGVTWFGPNGPALEPVGADGAFTMEHVPTGPVSVVLMSGAAGQYRSTSQVDTQVREGETTPVEFVLRSIAISGHLTRGGSPVVGARVEFDTTHGMRMFMGAGESDALPANAALTREDGGYQLVVGEPGEAWVEILAPDRKGHFPARPVKVPDADSYVADFSFSGAFVEGQVVERETEQPIAGAWVAAAPTDAKSGLRGGSGQTDTEGRFHLEVDPGEFRVSARAERHRQEGTTVSVGESGVAGVRLALGEGSSITGKVVDASGRGVGGLMVSGIGGEGISRSRSGTMSLPDGSFELADLLDAPYMVGAQAAGGLFGIAMGIVPGGKPITLGLRPGGRVRLKVLAADGSPAAGAMAFVSGYQGGPAGGNLGNGQADETGVAELLVPAGAVELSARNATGDRVGKTTVKVPPGGTVTAEVTLASPP